MISFTKRQDQIIDASLKIINFNGVQYYTIKRLAAEIDVTEGAIYKHFESKDAIVEAIIRYAQDHVNKVVEEIRRTEGSNLELLKKLFVDRCKYQPEDRPLASFMGIYNAIRNHMELKQQANRVVDTFHDEVKRIIMEGQRVGDIRPAISADSLFHMMLGTLHFLLNEWQRHDFHTDLYKQGQMMWNDIETFIANK